MSAKNPQYYDIVDIVTIVNGQKQITGPFSSKEAADKYMDENFDYDKYNASTLDLSFIEDRCPRYIDNPRET